MRTYLLSILFLAMVSPSQAQFRWGPAKTVQLSIPRPPDVGLTVKRIAFGEPAGDCAGELLDRMVMPDFQSNNIEVIDRQHLEQLMVASNVNASGSPDAASTVRLGKILGPSALVQITVYACKPDQDSSSQDGQDFAGAVHHIFISRTRFTLQGSVRIVDLQTGQVLGSRNFQDKPENQNTAEGAQPDFPPSDPLKDRALENVKWQIHNTFFPGLDTKDLIVYDDKDCGLKDAFGVWHRGDAEAARKLILAGIEHCAAEKKKEKALARAYYDVGLSYCLQQDYPNARPYFSLAMQTKGAEAVAEASADCERAQNAGAQVKSYLERFSRIPDPPAIVASDQLPSQPAGTADVSQPTPTDNQAIGAPTTPDPPSKPSVEERLKKLNALLKKGLITQKDYDKKKAEILNDI